MSKAFLPTHNKALMNLASSYNSLITGTSHIHNISSSYLFIILIIKLLKYICFIIQILK